MIRNLAQYSIKSLVKDYAKFHKKSITHSYLMYYHMGYINYVQSITYARIRNEWEQYMLYGKSNIFKYGT